MLKLTRPTSGDHPVMGELASSTLYDSKAKHEKDRRLAASTIPDRVWTTLLASSVGAVAGQGRQRQQAWTTPTTNMDDADGKHGRRRQ